MSKTYEISEYDKVRLLDLLTTTDALQRYVKFVDSDEFRADELRQNACRYMLAQLGSIVLTISAEFKMAHSEIQWANYNRLRNALGEGYDELSVVLVWDIIINELPPLHQQCLQIAGLTSFPPEQP